MDMSRIEIEHGPDENRLKELQVRDWPIWTKEESEFPWHYDDTEVCFILEGEIEVTPEGGEPVQIKVGDLVTFPQGMSCTWKISKAVKKHYTFK